MTTHSKPNLIDMILESGVCALSKNKLMKMNKPELKQIYVNIEKTKLKSQSNKITNADLESSDNEPEDEPEQKQVPKRDIRKIIKSMSDVFNKIVNQLIKDYRNDGDYDHLVELYNIEFSEIEHSINQLLENENTEQDYYTYADNLLSVQTNRIKRIK